MAGDHLNREKVSTKQNSRKIVKHQVLELLKHANNQNVLNELCRLPSRQMINLLFSFLYHVEPRIKWNAVTAMGALTAILANKDMEAARVIVRRLMWSLNDESGGIGWGAPEAMGEILANHETLAHEYYRILISYSREDGNFQENERIQEGVLWGIGRLSQLRPHLVKNVISHLVAYLNSSNGAFRGLTVWIMGLVGMKEAEPKLKALLQDDFEIAIYMDRELITRQIKDLAKEAIEKIKTRDVQC
ncbi:MAG: HEAT repeat domain-containing protein [Deltaproteobacteria bacterium]|nr:HEAT repeat domain-containing protein [Deltaproteobacteria bacterium]